MPIPILGKLVKGFVGDDGIVDAVNVETTGSSDVQSDLDNLGGALKIRTSPTLDATDATTFASSLSGQTPGLGDGYIVATAGEPFTGQVVKAAVGDVIFARVASPSLTNVAHWGITRNANGIPVSVSSDLFLQQLTAVNGVYGFTSNVQINGQNVTPNYRNVIEGSNGGQVANELTSLENRLSALTPLVPDVPYLRDLGDVYRPTQGAATVTAAQGYSSFIDYRSDSVRYESAGITYSAAGVDVVDYSGLGTDLHRGFGMRDAAIAQVNTITLTGASGTANITINAVNYLATFNGNLTTTASDFVTTHAAALDTAGITVTSDAAVLTFTAKVGGTAFTIAAPANVSGDLAGNLATVTFNKTLLSINDGGTIIPFVDQTTAGNYRINNFTPARSNSTTVTNQVTFATLSSGTGTIAVAGPVSTYTVQPYPADSTSQSRSCEIQFDVLINGVPDGAGGGVFVDIPDTNIVSTNDVEHTFFTGFPNNRHITATFRVATRVDGPDFVIDISLISTDPDVTFSINNVDTPLTFTTTNTIPRQDNWIVFQDAGGDFSYTGTFEFLIVFHPIPSSTRMNVVPVAVNVATGATTQLNDATISIPTPLFDAIQIPDNIIFRSFLPDHFLNHIDLVGFLANRDVRWVYTLAREETVTVRAFTEAIDLQQNSTMNGVEFSRDISGTAIGGTGNSVLTLPTDYTSFETLMYTVVEDGGQTTNHIMMTRELEANASINPLRISGNDTAVWDRTARTITLHETTDTWTQAILSQPRQS